jgi:multidrug efflux pump subunit AcrA (membrane-fusion protein)
MRTFPWTRSHRRLPAAGLAAAAMLLAGCQEVQEESTAGYEPAKLVPIKGTDDLKRVTFTPEGARRLRLRTASIAGTGTRKVVPYAALIYDPQGRTFVYVMPRPLTFLRRAVEVDRIDGDRAVLSAGPAAGTRVVTVGAVEVYGAELEIASH